jgi:YhcH/YjgK/YiaL family protein
MKSLSIISILPALVLLAVNLAAQSKSGEPLTKQKAQEWFKSKTWLGGLTMTPHASINQSEFARQYQKNKASWDKAFAWLKATDLQTIAKGRYPIEGDTVYASVTEDSSKDFEKTNWESHRKYIDLQSVIRGEEKIGVCPVSKATVTKAYDEKLERANYSAEGKYFTATPGTFFLFFPNDAHRPNITPGGNKVVKKVVIKIRYADENQK